MTEDRTKDTDYIPDEPSIEQLIARTEGSAKQTAESDNGYVANPLRQLSLQYDIAKDRYTNTSTTSSKPSVIGVDSYEFNCKKMRYAIFIINWEFDDQETLPFADLDCSNMYRLFETYGFTIVILENKTNAELKENLTVIRKSIGKDHDCLACIISSHGAEISLSCQPNQDQKLRQHVIYTKNGFLPTAEILQEFDNYHCTNLAEKPKMFFINACRWVTEGDDNSGVDHGVDVELSTDSNEMHTRHHTNTGVCSKDGDSTCVIPCNEDFLVMFASSSGRFAWNDEGKGGWLIYCLYTVFEKLLDTYYVDLLQILSQVCGKMARDLECNCPENEVYDGTKSAPVVYHMLTKSIYFKPKSMVEKMVLSKEK